MKPRLLLTGASGLFGANALFTGSGRFEILGTFHGHPILFPDAQIKQVDISDRSQVLETVADFKPEVIIHAAADSNIDHCETDHGAADRLNVAATRYLAEAAADRNALFIYFSTDAFFSNTRHGSHEKDPPQPVNYYGETKARAEEAVRKTSGRHIIVRTNFYGWNAQNKFSLAEWILFNLASGKRTPLFHDVVFTPLLANTLAEIIFELVGTGFTGTIHVAGSEPVSKLEFGRRLCKLFNLPQTLIDEVSVDQSKLTAPRAKGMALSVDKLKTVIKDRDLTVDTGLAGFKSLLDRGYAKTLKQAMGKDLGFLTLLQ